MMNFQLKIMIDFNAYETIGMYICMYICRDMHALTGSYVTTDNITETFPCSRINSCFK